MPKIERFPKLISVRIDRDVHATISTLSASRKVSNSDMIREAVKEYLERQ